MDTTVFEGIAIAVALCACGLLLSLRATHAVEHRLSHGDSSHVGQHIGVAGVYAGMLVRMMVAVIGIIAVYFLFGKERTVPCALAMLPLCFLEVMCGMVFHLRRVKHQRQIKREQ